MSTTPVVERAISRKESWTGSKETPSGKLKTAPSSSSKLTPKQTPVRTLKTGIDVNWQREFWEACRNGDVEMLTLISAQHRDKIQINKNDYEELDNTCLMKAAENGHLSVVRYLMEHGAASCIDTQNRNGNTAISLAAEKGNLAIVEYLFETAYADPHIRNSHGNTSLIRAAWKGHFETVKYLVESACVSVDAQNQVGNTALIIAAEKGDLPIIQFLIEEAGALTDLENDEGYSVLSKAASMGHLAVVQYLVEKGYFEVPSSPVVSSSGKGNNDTPLTKARLFAQSKGHSEVIEYLLRAEGKKR